MGKKICVIGSGLAGGIVASKLAAKGHCVTLVERGNAPMRLIATDETWEGAEPKVSFTRGTGIGGTSNFWHGGLTILDKTDIEGVPGYLRDHQSPISYSDLRKYYNRAISLLSDKQDYSLKDIESELTSCNTAFSINHEAFRFKALLYPTVPFSAKRLVERAKVHHGLRVVKNFDAKRLRFSGRSHIASVEGWEGQARTLKELHADVFILCAGGLGSPKILLESAKLNPQLQTLPIGRFLIDHPTGCVFKAKLRHRMYLKPLFGQLQQDFKIRYGFALKADQLYLSNYRNHVLFLRPAISMRDPLVYEILKRKLVDYRCRKLQFADMAYLLGRSDLLLEAANFKYGISHSAKYVMGLTFSEQFPDDRNRMFCSGDNKFAIDWNISREDARSLRKFLNVFFDSHSHLFESFTIFSNIRERLDSAGHHSGGCRMATQASDGVVDGDLRVFGVENLFVVDGSVLGFSGHANTGLTIAALAVKCCDAATKD